MENQIICPHCKKTISNDPVIESAVKGEDRGSTYIICDCGEKITFWAITAQLRDQKKPVARILHWFRSLSKS
jgi:RNase P subunit RPR2